MAETHFITLGHKSFWSIYSLSTRRVNGVKNGEKHVKKVHIGPLHAWS